MAPDPGPSHEGATANTPPPARTARDAANGSGKITREVVLAAALELIDAGGADALTMRRLARALGRDPMILYRHAPNKAALLNGVAETVLAQLTVDAADPDWAAQLRAVARHYRALALAHPRVVPLLVTRPLATPLALRPPARCARSKTSWPCSPGPRPAPAAGQRAQPDVPTAGSVAPNASPRPVRSTESRACAGTWSRNGRIASRAARISRPT